MPQRILDGGADAVRRLNRSSVHLFGLIARVRPDERRDAFGAFLTLFGFMAGHALLETARDALFLASLSARRLPWVYLVIATLALAIGQREPRVVRRLSRRSELGRWLLMAAAVTSVFWLFVVPGRTWVLYALYVWSGVLASLVVVRFWTLLGSRFTMTQAKRIFPVIATGSVAGAIVGFALARGLAEFVGPRHLVLAAAFLFLVTAAAPSVLASEEVPGRRARTITDLGDVARRIWSGPYLLRVGAMVLLATVTFTLVDYVFKSAAGRMVAADDLGQFFSSAYLAFSVLSLFVQVFVVGWLLRNVGLVRVSSFVPAALLIPTFGFAVGGGLSVVLLLKGADGALRHSLHRTVTELLFVPLSDRLRTQVKGVIDVLGQRGGQALASILILMLLSTTADERVFAVLACFTAAAWLVVTLGLREPYLNLFRETLHVEHAPRGSGFPAIDMASLEALLATLNTADDRRVMAALDVLASQGKQRVIPALLLYHPSPLVVVHALDLFGAGRRDDILPIADRLRSHADPDVRAAALRGFIALAPSRALFEEALSDPDARVSATALAGLCLIEGPHPSDRLAELLAVVRSGDAQATRAVAAAVRARTEAAAEPILVELLRSEDVSTLSAAIESAGRVPSTTLIDRLIVLLGRRAVRADARSALARFGTLVLPQLTAALASEELPQTLRRHVPLAIAMVGSVDAPQILLRRLEVETDGMIRFKLLRALGRWRREQPGFPLDGAMLSRSLGIAVSTAFRLMGWRRVLVRGRDLDPRLGTEVHAVLVALLRDKQGHALERAFRLLNLQSGSEEFQRVYRGLHSPQPESRAGSRELLLHMVPAPVRRPLLTLVDDMLAEDPIREPDLDDADDAGAAYRKVIGELLGCGLESASSLAAVHAEELGLVDVVDMARSTPPISDEHAATLRRAVAGLEAGAHHE